MPETLGYLETDYSTIPYGGGVTEKLLGIQFEVINTPNRNLGTQFGGDISVQNIKGVEYEGVITLDKGQGAQFFALNIDAPDTTGVQAKGKIDTGIEQFGVQFGQTPIVVRSIGEYNTGIGGGGYGETSYSSPIYAKFMGTQFEAVNVKEKSTGAQFEGHITVDTSRGVQFLGKITDDKPIGAQFEAFVQRSVSLQFRAVIYNTTQLRFLSEFPSRGVTGTNWTATTTEASSSNSFDVNNLNTDIVEQVWRSADTNVTSLTCDTEDSGGVFLDTLAILNHNLTQGASITLIGSNSPSFTTTPFVEQLSVEPNNMYYISEQLPLQSYRYWRLDINDTTNPNGFLEIGTIVFGSSTVFTTEENFTDEVTFGIKQFEDSIQTEGFTNISNDRGQKKYLDLSFKKLQGEGRNFGELRKLFESAGSLLKVLWVPTPQKPSQLALFSKMTSIPKEKQKYSGELYVDLTVNLDESK